MATRLKIIETNEAAHLSAPKGVVADIVAARVVPDFDPVPTRKRRAGRNCRAQLARGTGEHRHERPRLQAPRVRAGACARTRVEGTTLTTSAAAL